MGVDGLAWGVGYGVAEAGEQSNLSGSDDNDEHMTVANYSTGPVTFGAQLSDIRSGSNGTKLTEAIGIAFNVNDDLSISYGEREVEFGTAGGTHVTEEGDGIAIAYTMGSMKIAGNRNEVKNNDGTGSSDND